MKYDFIIKDMRWSYSRINAFQECRYAWFLKYIKEVPNKQLFFSNYGKFMHKILEMYFTGLLKKEELSEFYISNFFLSVSGKAPNLNVFNSYFEAGLDYLYNFEFPIKNISSIEKEINFKIGDFDFLGYIDVIADNGKIILDHKSKDLKPRSGKKKPLKSDLELDKYLKQLYLYAIATKEIYGEYPQKLIFNCFKLDELISEDFDEGKIEEIKQWILSEIDIITNNDDWKPTLNYWRCNYLCDVCDSCEYKEML
jgi:hypothetical protein